MKDLIYVAEWLLIAHNYRYVKKEDEDQGKGRVVEELINRNKSCFNTGEEAKAWLEEEYTAVQCQHEFISFIKEYRGV